MFFYGGVSLKKCLLVHIPHASLMIPNDMLNKKVSNMIDKYNKCILVDLHSFSDLFIKKMFGKDGAPDVCIGVENKYTSILLGEQIVRHFKKDNYSVKINYPYEGSIIPNKYFAVYDERLDTIMIELNKKIYLNNNNKLDKKKFNKLKRCFNKYFKVIK